VIDFRIGGDLVEAVGKCRMSVSNPIFYSQSYSVSLQKDNRFTKAVDREYALVYTYIISTIA